MTEADWGTSADPAAMLTLAADRVSDRKLRLYLVGCCRRRWDLFTDGRCRRAVAVAERLADGRATEADRAHAVVLAREASEQAARERRGTLFGYNLADVAWAACDLAADLRRPLPLRNHQVWAAIRAETVATESAGAAARAGGGGPTQYDAALAVERAAQADLLRCVFGNPFVYTVPDPAWRTTAVLGLAAAAYADRAFDRLPILADALEEAGCDEPAVLAHCRRDREHARGCWVVDLLLDKS